MAKKELADNFDAPLCAKEVVRQPVVTGLPHRSHVGQSLRPQKVRNPIALQDGQSPQSYGAPKPTVSWERVPGRAF